MHDIQDYQKLNNSFSKTLLFGVGLKAGLYSEINNMILAVLFCLHHGIRFNLQSKNANFCYQNGWTDYFEPFCPEKNIETLINRNFRMRIHVPKSRTISKLKTNFVKRLYGVDYFTYELFDAIRNRENEKIFYNIPELGISGDLLHAAEKIISLIYRPNSKTVQTFNERIRRLQMPEKYVGFHIRGGDKILEQKLLGAEKYFLKAESETNLRTAFVLTDEFSVIRKIKERFPEWKIFTLTSEEEEGYVHSDFSRMDPEYKKMKITNLLASVEILSSAEITFCTYSSNVGMFLKMRNNKKTIGLDYENWQIF